MAGKVQYMSLLALNELYRKLKNWCSENRHKPYTWPL